MRDIKFRAFDKQEKVMCQVGTINFELGCFLIGNSPTPAKVDERFYIEGIKEGHFVNFDNLELMQFTGMLDKEGKEIYEGDILKGGIYLQYEVKWDYQDCGWNISSESRIFEVIGNIYETKEK